MDPHSDQAGDLRLLARIWVDADGEEPLRTYLQSDYRADIDESPFTGLDDYLLDHLSLIDEALGLAPQSGDQPLLADAAIGVLTYLPPWMMKVALVRSLSPAFSQWEREV